MCFCAIHLVTKERSLGVEPLRMRYSYVTLTVNGYMLQIQFYCSCFSSGVGPGVPATTIIPIVSTEVQLGVSVVTATPAGADKTPAAGSRCSDVASRGTTAD